MTARLTDRGIRSLVATSKRIELTDAQQGLVLRVSPSGRKTFSYVYKADSALRRIALGEYPALGLAEARLLAAEQRKKRLRGDDPRLAQDRERAQQAAARAAEANRQQMEGRTFDQLCDLYIEVYAKPNKTSWKNDIGYLKRPRQNWGPKPAASISKKDVTDLLDAIARTSKSSANRTQSVLRTLWGWAAVENDYLPVNFLAGMKKRGGKEVSRDRVLEADEIKALWAALADEDVPASKTVRLALKTILLTAQRPNEVAGMVQTELQDLNGETPLWIIPRERTKNKKSAHTVPLSPLAVQLINEACDRPDGTQDEDDPAVFASRFESTTTIARHSLSQATRRIVAHYQLKHFTPHDLRRTAATLAQSQGSPREHVQELLNHKEGDVTATYARYNMFSEKRLAVQAIERALSLILATPLRSLAAA